VRSRGLHLAVLIFQALWLNVIVPGHQRGVVQLQGSEKVSQPVGCPFCCECGATSKNTKSNSPPAAPGNCAICSFAAHLCVPPVVDLSLQQLRLLHRVPGEIAENLFARSILLTSDERGPPAVGY
jgi:hypothetical protein